MTRDDSSRVGLSDEIEELLTGYVLDHLSTQERARAEALIQKYPDVQQELVHLEAMMGLMAHGVPPIKAPTALRSQILKAAQLTSASPPIVRVPSSEKRSWRGWRIAASLAIGLGLLLGLDNISLRTQVAKLESDVKLLTASEHKIFKLQGTKVSPAASGNVVLDLEHARAAITLQHVPVLPKGSQYYLWAITSNKPVPCGVFQPDLMGRVAVNIEVPIHEYTGQASRLFVTQESSEHVQHPSAKIVMDSVS
jgi:anti-sigma-K factor RskA